MASTRSLWRARSREIKRWVFLFCLWERGLNSKNILMIIPFDNMMETGKTKPGSRRRVKENKNGLLLAWFSFPCQILSASKSTWAVLTAEKTALFSNWETCFYLFHFSSRHKKRLVYQQGFAALDNAHSQGQGDVMGDCHRHFGHLTLEWGRHS